MYTNKCTYSYICLQYGWIFCYDYNASAYATIFCRLRRWSARRWWRTSWVVASASVSCCCAATRPADSSCGRCQTWTTRACASCGRRASTSCPVRARRRRRLTTYTSISLYATCTSSTKLWIHKMCGQIYILTSRITMAIVGVHWDTVVLPASWCSLYEYIHVCKYVLLYVAAVQWSSLRRAARSGISGAAWNLRESLMSWCVALMSSPTRQLRFNTWARFILRNVGIMAHMA